MSDEFVSSLDDLSSVKCYLERIGATPRSLRAAVVREGEGNYWRDVATIRFDTAKGAVEAPTGFEPTEEEAEKIGREVLGTRWPEVVPLWEVRERELPDGLRRCEQRYELRDDEGRIVMIQARVETEEGKSYIPWTYWSDKEWRRMEPGGPLPLWGLDQLKHHSTVFLHEGAKAAAWVRWMVEGKTKEARAAHAAHPWGQDLRDAAHLGWIGGAPNPHRADWAPLQRAIEHGGVSRVYIVADNDKWGIRAVPKIAERLRVPTFSVEFGGAGGDWPPGFDLGDPFPGHMFADVNGERVYNGPSFDSCVQVATWATDLVPDPESKKGRKMPVLRESFRAMWLYVDAVEMYACREMPWLRYDDRKLNKRLRSFSHARNTVALIDQAYDGWTTKLCYRPELPKQRVVVNEDGQALNLYRPPSVRALRSTIDYEDPPWQPFLDFLSYLFPVPYEREHVKRWLATLFARPDIHIGHALLLASQTQGVGKDTLGWRTTWPLVGRHNAVQVSEATVKGTYTGWKDHVRLVFCSEIYAGDSWKPYNALKDMITNKEVEIHYKYENTYYLENRAHVIACSNADLPVRIKQDDRRWFIPDVTEQKDEQETKKYIDWLKSGAGHPAILTWAKEFEELGGSYCSKERMEDAPMTAAKKQKIEESRSEAEAMAASMAERLSRFGWADDEAEAASAQPAAVPINAVRDLIKERLRPLRMYEKPSELRKAMRSVAGVREYPKQIKIDGATQVVMMNGVLWRELQPLRSKDDDSEEKRRRVRECAKAAAQLAGEEAM